MPPQGPLDASLLSLQSHGHSQPTKSENNVEGEKCEDDNAKILRRESPTVTPYIIEATARLTCKNTFWGAQDYWAFSWFDFYQTQVKGMVSMKCVPNMITRVVTSSMISNLYPIYQYFPHPHISCLIKSYTFLDAIAVTPVRQWVSAL